jgi:hypothetical protein
VAFKAKSRAKKGDFEPPRCDSVENQMSHEKYQPVPSHYPGWLIGVSILGYHNPK